MILCVMCTSENSLTAKLVIYITIKHFDINYLLVIVTLECITHKVFCHIVKFINL